jgi:hypothetical protein
VHDGEGWLPERARDPRPGPLPGNLDVVAVNSGSSDGSAAILARRLPADRIVTMERNLGFGRAVAAAVAQSEVVARPTCSCSSTTTSSSLRTRWRAWSRRWRQDETLGIVGPKLRDWGEERVLQEVGLTIDRLGRAESRLEPGELDQGQHDTQRPVLYVSTAGCCCAETCCGGSAGSTPATRLPRRPRPVLARLARRRARRGRPGRRRLPPAPPPAARAPGRARAGLGGALLRRAPHPRDAAEELRRPALLWVLPVVLWSGLVKVLGFLATRRFGDALATVRAYAWNFGPAAPDAAPPTAGAARRAVADTEVLGCSRPGCRACAPTRRRGKLARRRQHPRPHGRRRARAEVDGRSALRTLRGAPGAAVGRSSCSALPPRGARLLGAGQIVGGEVAPWPEQARTSSAPTLSPWNGEPLASEAFASPAQALLGLVSLLGLGSAWLAQRLVVLGLLPLAWLLAVRAGRLVTARPGPRVLGATLYVISPVLLGALAEGASGVLVVAALLPGLLLVGVRAADP